MEVKTVLGSERETFADRIHRVATDALFVDDVLHICVPEPVLLFHASSPYGDTFASPHRFSVDEGGTGPAHSGFEWRVFRMDEAAEARGVVSAEFGMLCAAPPEIEVPAPELLALPLENLRLIRAACGLVPALVDRSLDVPAALAAASALHAHVSRLMDSLASPSDLPSFADAVETALGHFAPHAHVRPHLVAACERALEEWRTNAAGDPQISALGWG
jgi:hypothetical protein